MTKFYEIDITTMGEEKLMRIYRIVRFANNNPGEGWNKYIEDLEMTLDDNGNIIVRGWATKPRWDNFVKVVIKH